MNNYKCEYEDGNFEILLGTDEDIFQEACKYEEEHGCLFNIFEINEDNEEIRTIL